MSGLERIQGELVLALKGKEWGGAPMARSINHILRNSGTRLLSGVVVALPGVKKLGLAAPDALGVLLEGAALKQLGRDGFQKMIKTAWMAANPSGMPGKEPGYCHFLGESLLEALWA